MTAPMLWVTELARAFWQEVRTPEPFPRTLHRPLRFNRFDLTIKEMPGLTITSVERYLAGLGAGWSCGQPDRPLRACLAARAGAGFIFLAADDRPEERVFSLAHEIAHFLRDYWQPRCRAVAALGEAILEVLDGQRALRPGERLSSLLRGFPIGFHVHLMRRAGGVQPPDIAAAEEAADRLAWELLAPAAEVGARLAACPGISPVELLRNDFGLPAGVAQTYAEFLFPPGPSMDPLVSRLQKSLAARRTLPG